MQRQRLHSQHQRHPNPRLPFRYLFRNTVQPIVRSLICTLTPDAACEVHRFDLRFLRPLRADLSIRKSSSFFPPLIAATSQRGFSPRPAQVSPDGPRYFGGTFLPFKALPPPPTTLAPPTTANLSNCFSISARRL